jgi:hypothetical protein
MASPVLCDAEIWNSVLAPVGNMWSVSMLLAQLCKKRLSSELSFAWCSERIGEENIVPCCRDLHTSCPSLPHFFRALVQGTDGRTNIYRRKRGLLHSVHNNGRTRQPNSWLGFTYQRRHRQAPWRRQKPEDAKNPRGSLAWKSACILVQVSLTYTPPQLSWTKQAPRLFWRRPAVAQLATRGGFAPSSPRRPQHTASGNNQWQWQPKH